MTHWQVYQPRAAEPWNLRRVVHLHRRVVFGATQLEIERDLNDDPQQAVSRVLSGECRLNGVPEGFDRLAAIIGDSAAQSNNPNRLKAWWIYRCLYTPDPLQEKLTLMWHNHFATSNQKVDNLLLMKQQNETLRRYCKAPFRDLLNAMLLDSALLMWLDAEANRASHPNENLAREIMELFTLGIGNYTETDVKELARALTGLRTRIGQVAFEVENHDPGQKLILGRTGRFTPTDVPELLLGHPAVAQRLAHRLIDEFFAEGVVSSAAVDELAGLLKRSQLDISAAVETILRSGLFFSESNISNRVCDPLTFQVSLIRCFEQFQRPPSTSEMASWLSQMGFDLFYPPNVGGWNQGRGWLNARTVIARTNFIATFASGELASQPTQDFPRELKSIVKKRAPNSTLIKFATRVLLGLPDSKTGDDDNFSTLDELMALPNVHLH